MNRMLGFVTTIGVMSTMIATNPGQHAYTQYTVQRLVQDVQTRVCSESDPPDLVHGTCSSTLLGIGVWQQDNLERAVNLATHRDGYLLWSVYTTVLPGKTYRAIGLMSTFIPLA